MKSEELRAYSFLMGMCYLSSSLYPVVITFWVNLKWTNLHLEMWGTEGKLKSGFFPYNIVIFFTMTFFLSHCMCLSLGDSYWCVNSYLLCLHSSLKLFDHNQHWLAAAMTKNSWWVLCVRVDVEVRGQLAGVASFSHHVHPGIKFRSSDFTCWAISLVPNFSRKKRVSLKETI